MVESEWERKTDKNGEKRVRKNERGGRMREREKEKDRCREEKGERRRKEKE